MFILVESADSSRASKCCSGVVSVEAEVEVGLNRVARLFLDLVQPVSVKHKLEMQYVPQLQKFTNFVDLEITNLGTYRVLLSMSIQSKPTDLG